MTNDAIIAALLTALRKIGEVEKVLEATCPADWRRRAQIIAKNAVAEAEKSLRMNRAELTVKDEA